MLDYLTRTGSREAASPSARSSVEKVKPQPLRTRPRVSVVIPCYNYAHYLTAAVESALDQPGVDIEVVIADNGSTDNSLEVARRLAAFDDRIRIHTQPRNVNFISNFNAGLALVTGKYTHLLNADDLLTPGAITRAVAVMEYRSDVVFTYGSCPVFCDSTPKLRKATRSWSIWDGHEWTRSLYRSGRNVIRNPEVLMRTSTLEDIGGYNVDYPFATDMLLWLQAAARGSVARINGPDQGLFRMHGANMHTAWPEGWLTDLKSRQAVFDDLAALDPHASVGVEEIRESHRALAADAAHLAAKALHSRTAGQRDLGLAYAEYSLSLWPEIEQTRRWQQVRTGMQGNMPAWRATVSAVHRRARSIVGSTLNEKLRTW